MQTNQNRDHPQLSRRADHRKQPRRPRRIHERKLAMLIFVIRRLSRPDQRPRVVPKGIILGGPAPEIIANWPDREPHCERNENPDQDFARQYGSGRSNTIPEYVCLRPLGWNASGMRFTTLRGIFQHFNPGISRRPHFYNCITRAPILHGRRLQCRRRPFDIQIEHVSIS
jgi:hypothetical protein